MRLKCISSEKVKRKDVIVCVTVVFPSSMMIV